MVERIQIVGMGRVGSAVAARLGDRVSDVDPELVLLCVPDRAIAEVAQTIPVGPWIAHTSGATPARGSRPS